DMGFIHDIKKVLAIVPAKKQSLLFSATFSDEIKTLADRLLNKPQVIEVARRNTTAETIAQKVIPVGRERKKELLAHLIQSQDWHQVLVFTRMKHGANRLTEYLNKVGITAMAIHGNKSQGARTKALAEFKSGELAVLVATDIAARGIDIDQLPHVINFELPNVPEDYVHRIGRTGRAGAQGEALSLVCVDEEGFLADIEKLIKRSIPRTTVPGYEPDPSERAEPIQLGRRTLNGSLKGSPAVGSRGQSRGTHPGASQGPAHAGRGRAPSARSDAPGAARGPGGNRGRTAASDNERGKSTGQAAGQARTQNPQSRPSVASPHAAPRAPHAGTTRAADSAAASPRPRDGHEGSRHREGSRSGERASRSSNTGALTRPPARNRQG
ncbi:MAG TPA: helicase-related protein, partial [Burkholderiaceae bacterium]|nr:helicase-related protein [Burkholderiaceae bacterium]